MVFYYWLVFILQTPDHWLWLTMIGPLTMTKYVGLAASACAIFHITIVRHLPSLFRNAATRWYLTFFSAALISAYLYHRGPQVSGVDNIVSTLILFLVTTILVDSMERLRRTLLVIFASAAVASLYEIRQWVQFRHMYVGWRPGGVFGDPNYYAIAIVLWLPVCFNWMLTTKSRLERWFCFGCVSLQLIGLMLSGSRGGILGIGTAMLFLLLRSPRRALGIAILAPIVLFAATALPSSPMQRLLHPNASDQRSTEERLALWKIGWDEFCAHPIFGVGMNNYAFDKEKYQQGQLGTHVLAHNTYVEIAAELGLIGLASYLGILIATFISLGRMAKSARRAGSALLYQVSLGMQAGILAFAFGAIFLTTWWQQTFWLGIFISACLTRMQPVAVRALHAVRAGAYA